MFTAMKKKRYDPHGHGVNLSAVDKAPKHMEIIMKPSERVCRKMQSDAVIKVTGSREVRSSRINVRANSILSQTLSIYMCSRHSAHHLRA